MKKILFAIGFIFSVFGAFAQAGPPLYGMQDVTFVGNQHMLVKLPPVYNNPAWADSTFPVIFNFGGNGETSEYGDVTILFNQGYPKRVKDNKQLYPLSSTGQPIYYISICPQGYASGSFSQEGSMRQVWDYTVANYRCDTSKYASGPFVGKYRRILYAGLSQGAADIHNQYVSQWNAYNYRNQRLGKFMSASMPYLQFEDSIQRVADRRLIAFAGEFDGYPGVPDNRVFIDATTQLVNKYNTYTPGSANLTVIAGQGHTSVVWDSAWSTYNTPTKNLYRLLIDDFADAPAGNVNPIALAGLDVTVQIGNGVTLQGQNSNDPDGSIASYAWTKISGPAQFTIQSPSAASTFISNLAAGVYVFRLTVTDNLGATNSDDVQVTVQSSPNAAPTANAGPDQTLVLPTNSTQLTGLFSTDPDGNIINYQWLKLSGGSFVIDNTASPTPNLSGLVAGEYIFQLTVYDNTGVASQPDQVKITVATSGGIVKIPLDYRRFNQQNNFEFTLEKLVDNDVSTDVITGTGKVLKNFDTWYEFPPAWNVSVSKIRGFDPPGGWFGEPFTVYGIEEGSWTRQLLGVFTGEFNNPNGGWDEINFAPKNLRYLIFNTYSTGGDHFPRELEVYGTYTPVPVPAFTIPKKNFENYFGANVYAWNITQNSMFPHAGADPYLPKWDIMQDMTNYRMYINWEMLEFDKGLYKYNPSYTGSWNLDTALYQTSRGNRYNIVTIKAQPGWLQATYPSNDVNNEATPVPWANPVGSNYLTPAAYLDIGKMYFQFVRRYGSNSSLTNVTVAPGQTLRAGLGYIRAMEIENERDKWWLGRKGYQTGREYGMMLSVLYDGHNNTMGPGVGIHNADASMPIIIAGTAQPQTDWMKGAYDWWREFRPETPWPFIDNYHNYPMDFNQIAGRAYAPDLDTYNSNYLPRHADEHNYIRQFFTNKEVQITETGVEINETSPLKAVPRGNRNVLQTQGDWIYRTALLTARKKLDRLFFYEWADNQQGIPGLFLNTGIVDGIAIKKRPAYNYLQQAKNIIGKFQFDTSNTVTVGLNTVTIDKYTKSPDSVRYVALIITDSVASATYSYQLANSSKFIRYWEPRDDQDYAYATYITPVGGIAQIPVSQTPIIFEEVTATPAFTTASADAGADQNLTLPLTFNFNGNNRISGPLPVLSGSGADVSGPVAFQWVQLSGPTTAKIERPYNQVSNLYNLHQGTYVFQLQVTNMFGRMTTDNITINVANVVGNAVPVAKAGVDTSFRLPTNSIVLNGLTSTDDGSIVAYEWKKVSGPTWGILQSPLAATCLVFFMTSGTYVFELTVTDNQGASHSVRKNVVVLPAVDAPNNNLPTANAGVDLSISLPVNTVTLNGIGQDPDGGVSYLWQMVNGPASYNISNNTIGNPIISNLVAGTYTFRLTVTDGQGAQAIDDVVVTVSSGGTTTGRLEYATVEYFNGTCNQTATNATIKKNAKGQLSEVKLSSGALVPLGDVRRVLGTKILNQ